MATKTSILSRHVAVLRIIFGLMWSVDAVFKWMPSFTNNSIDIIKSAADGQPHWLAPWFSFWTNTWAHSPHALAVLTALAESLIALALLLGLARRTTYLAAAAFSLLIWSTAEGFGGPYTANSTDIGAAVIYAVVFFSLYGLERLAVPARWSVDRYIVKKLPWWAILANP